MSASNSTGCPSFFDGHPTCFKTPDVPFYYSYNQTLVKGVSDHHLALAAPILAYWSLSLVFHFLDTREWKSLEKYRIHDSAEVSSRNLVTRSQVVWAVIFQQIVQTFLGYFWLSDKATETVRHAEKMEGIAYVLLPVVQLAGSRIGSTVLPDLVYYTYWWAIPAIQFLFAIFFIDTWQYFLHRFMHVNKFLYRKFHSWHHRLYVPYAFGSLYNHPVEGFLLDTLGAALAELLSGMSTRQAMLLFVVSTFKTVDDHCGYRLPFDPLQFLTANNADYHDIHHQTIGIKSNFAQPFFVHWDVLLHTRMTRAEMEQRKDKTTGKKE